MGKKEVFIERREQGDYAVRRPGSARASVVRPTQKDAVDWAKEHIPEATPIIERVRETDRGKPDQWRGE
jgi:Uncharacterized protein conserved in bacteria (DUF2188)